MKDEAGYTLIKALGDLLAFRADIVRYSFKRHDHDYYAVGIIEDGVQRFSCGSRRLCLTPPKGISIINPGDAHTGESALDTGFRYWAIYPSVEQFSAVAAELGLSGMRMPEFPDPVVRDNPLYFQLCDLRASIDGGKPILVQESLYLGVLADLILRHAALKPRIGQGGREHGPVSRVKAYIEENYRSEVRLDDLAREAGLSRFYLIRSFRARLGQPPHAYLESVRVRHAQALLRSGKSLAEVAYDIGFSSQSHFTSTFKSITGVSPGRYVRAIS